MSGKVAPGNGTPMLLDISAGKKETVAVGTACSHSPVRCVDAGSSERIVTVTLDNSAVGVCEVGHAAFMILLREIPVPLVVCAVCAALNDFIDAFSIQVKSNQDIVFVVFQNRLLPVVKIIGSDGIVDRAFHATAQRVVAEIVRKTRGGDLLSSWSRM